SRRGEERNVMKMIRKHWKLSALALICCIALAVFAGSVARGAPGVSNTSFDMVRSGASITAGCLPHAGAHVTINSIGPVERMIVIPFGLPPNTDFDFFVI